MTNSTLTNDEKRCLQMWFRHAIAEVEREEATRNIVAFYNGESKAREGHHSPVGRRVNRRPVGHKELV